MKRYVSIDIGGTAIKYGVLNGDGELVCRSEMRTESYKGGMSILAKAVGIVEGYCGTGTVDGICISTAGMVDTKKGEIFHSAPLIPKYAGTRFKETMESRFGIPCEVENDVNCAGLAESVSGASKGSSSSLMLTIGTGIGGCAIIDGKVFHASATARARWVTCIWQAAISRRWGRLVSFQGRWRNGRTSRRRGGTATVSFRMPRKATRSVSGQSTR